MDCAIFGSNATRQSSNEDNIPLAGYRTKLILRRGDSLKCETITYLFCLNLLGKEYEGGLSDSLSCQIPRQMVDLA